MRILVIWGQNKLFLILKNTKNQIFKNQNSVNYKFIIHKNNNMPTHFPFLWKGSQAYSILTIFTELR